jgi:hypothetical protein
MLIRYEAHLQAGMQTALREALDRACRAIVKRNVGPEYTNIAIMGAGVTAAGGEILHRPDWVTYAADRLRRLQESVRYHGSFVEYNSPTYTVVAIKELERILALVKDETCRASASALLETGWAVVATHWHPGTGEWAGPHARAYSDRIRSRLQRFLQNRQARPGSRASTPEADAVPCPARWRSRFAQLPQDPCQTVQSFVKRPAEADCGVGTTWMTADACLGSIRYDCCWQQRHGKTTDFASPRRPGTPGSRRGHRSSATPPPSGAAVATRRPLLPRRSCTRAKPPRWICARPRRAFSPPGCSSAAQTLAPRTRPSPRNRPSKTAVGSSGGPWHLRQ